MTPDFFPQHNLVVSPGRPVAEIDESGSRTWPSSGPGAADALFPGQDPVGRAINLDDIDGPREYKVVGVTEPKTLAGMSEAGANADLNRVVFIPFATDRLRFGREVVTSTGRVVPGGEDRDQPGDGDGGEDGGRAGQTAAVLDSVLGQYHPRKDVAVFVPLELLQKAEQTQRLFTLVLGAIAGVSLVVGGIGIMNIMLATVTERTSEIGIRRALGAKQRDIAAQFLVETVILSCGGGVLGVLVGLAGAYLLTWAADCRWSFGCGRRCWRLACRSGRAGVGHLPRPAGGPPGPGGGAAARMRALMGQLGLLGPHGTLPMGSQGRSCPMFARACPL